jgi:hypothetical protein
MTYYREECEQMVLSKANVLLLDTYTGDGTPLLVIRSITCVA